MAAGITGKTAVADSLPDTFIAEVKTKVHQGPVARNAINNVTLPMGEGGQWEQTELTRATAIALTDGVDLASAEQITDSTLQITPSEFGAQVVVTDLARDQITKKTDLVRQVGRILGNSMVTKEDIDILTQLDSFSVALGSAGYALNIGHIMAAGAAIRSGGQAAAAIVAGTQEPAPGPFYGIFNDNMLHNVNLQEAFGTAIGISATATGLATSYKTYGAEPTGTAVFGAVSPVQQGQALAEAYVGKKGQVNVLSDNNLAKDASDDAKGGVFSKEAIIQVHFRGGPKMEPERDASKRATEYNIVMVKGIGEWKDAWGREMLFDAASPTS